MVSDTGSRRPRVHVSFAPPPAVAPLLGQQDWRLSIADSPAGQDREQLLHAIQDTEGVVTLLSDRVDEEFFETAGPGLRIVANYAVGYDNVDLAAAARRGVLVSNTPGVLNEATADLTFALILATSRRVVEADRFVRSGAEWSWRPDLFLGLDISGGTTLGIVGLGRIGQAVALRAAAFNMRVVATSAPSAADRAKQLGVELVALDELMRQSDVVTIHCPLNDQTRHLVGRSELRLIGPSGILVNTARGAIVDEQALVDALEAGELGGAGLDVYENEPHIPQGLVSREDVVVLPHIASAGIRTRERMAELAIANVAAVLQGDAPLTPVI